MSIALVESFKKLDLISEFPNNRKRALSPDSRQELSRLSPDQTEASKVFKSLGVSILFISRNILKAPEKTIAENHAQAQEAAGLISNKLEVLRVDSRVRGVSPDIIDRVNTLQRGLISLRDAPLCDPRVFGRRVNKVACFAGGIALEIEKC